MERWKALLLLLISLAFVGAGAWIWWREPEAGAAAWGVLLFFGACAVVGAVELLGLPRSKRGRAPDAPTDRLVAYANPVYGLLYGAACLGFVAGGLLIAEATKEHVGES